MLSQIIGYNFLSTGMETYRNVTKYPSDKVLCNFFVDTFSKLDILYVAI